MLIYASEVDPKSSKVSETTSMGRTLSIDTKKTLLWVIWLKNRAFYSFLALNMVIYVNL